MFVRPCAIILRLDVKYPLVHVRVRRVDYLNDKLAQLATNWGRGIVQWLERRTRDLKGRGFEVPVRRENFLLQGRLSVLTLISVSVPPPCYHSST